jgi:hypothetical protein
LCRQRPERTTGNGLDALWAIGGLQYLVLEAEPGGTWRWPHHRTGGGGRVVLRPEQLRLAHADTAQAVRLR